MTTARELAEAVRALLRHTGWNTVMVEELDNLGKLADKILSTPEPSASETVREMREWHSPDPIDLRKFAHWADVLEAAEADRDYAVTETSDTIRSWEEAKARIPELEAENANLQKWIDDCQAGMYINCVYCGHRYGPDDGDHLKTMRQALEAHISACPKHPLSSANARIAELEQQLAAEKERNLMFAQEWADWNMKTMTDCMEAES